MPARRHGKHRRPDTDGFRTMPGMLGSCGGCSPEWGRYRALDRDAVAYRADPRPLAMPVLVVAGGAPDLTVPPVTPLAPQRRVVVIPGAGHYVPVERPAAFAEAVRGWPAE